jgi:uncharacterized protein (DUF2147 family)
MKAVVAQNLNAIPVVPSGTSDAFIQLASNWLGKWWRLRERWQTVSPGFCALICEPDFTVKAAFKDFEIVELFREMPAKTMGGAIYVTDGVLGKVYRKKGSFDDANAIVKEICSAGLAGNPAVLFEPEVGTMLLAKGGVNQPPTLMQFGSFSPALTIENLDKQLTWLYTSTLKYPTNFPQIWFNAPKFIPIFEAEKLFQSTALIHLRTNQVSCAIARTEDDNNAGRTDISISTLSPPCVFVIEIKVLKSFKYNHRSYALVHKDEENMKWATEGITQVVGYRLAQQASEAFLLLYDMRQKEEKITLIKDRCVKDNVLPRHYFIHNATAAKVNKRTMQRP